MTCRQFFFHAFIPAFGRPLMVLAILLISIPRVEAQRALSLTRVASGLSSPIYATHAPGDPNSLYVVEQGGNIRILNLSTGTINSNPFLSNAQLSAGNGFSSGGERGLLGLAFDPNFTSNNRYYVNYTDQSGSTRVRSFLASGSQTVLNSQAEILQISQPFTNHNAGWMDFGPDGSLYIATGDGGSGNDPGNRALDRSSLLGKMLRINPGTTSAGGYSIPNSNPFFNDGNPNTRDEIWAYGLRNPWRNSFDRATGDLYIADVGQNQREEVNFQSATSSGGENYGWRTREGTRPTGLSGQPGTGPEIDPIYDYLHGSGQFQGRSVTGGYVYRGPIEALQGHYFFGDFVSQRLFSLKFDGSSPQDFDGTNHTELFDWTSIVDLDFGTLGPISSFAEDAAGNLYLINYSGNIYRFDYGVIPEPGSAMVLISTAAVCLLRRRRA